jgi:hypothetical protein
VIVGDVGDGDLRVPQDLHHDPRRNAHGEQERGAPVPGVVQADAGESRPLRDARERAAGLGCTVTMWTKNQ